MRQTFIRDGFSTVVNFSVGANIQLYEREVTPPGVDGGGPIDITTMLNEVVHTKAPKQLWTLDNMTGSFAYLPVAYPQFMDIVNVLQAIEVVFADLTTLVFWGWLDKFKPGPNKIGELPLAEVTIVPSLMDNTGTEVLPFWS